MSRKIVNNKMRLSNKEINKVYGGGLVVPTIPNIPYVTAPGDYGKEKKDEPKDGGATGGW